LVDLNLVNGDVVEMIVDRRARTVTWLTNGIKIVESLITFY